MALVGYARVPTRDQHPQAQTDALSAAGCTKTFTDHAARTLAQRPALEQALNYLRPATPWSSPSWTGSAGRCATSRPCLSAWVTSVLFLARCSRDGKGR